MQKKKPKLKPLTSYYEFFKVHPPNSYKEQLNFDRVLHNFWKDSYHCHLNICRPSARALTYFGNQSTSTDIISLLVSYCLLDYMFINIYFIFYFFPGCRPISSIIPAVNHRYNEYIRSYRVRLGCRLPLDGLALAQ